MKRDQHLKPPSPSLPLLFIGRSRFLFPRFSTTALLFDPRWMGVFNTLDKVVRVKYGFVETIVSNNRIVGEASRKRGRYSSSTWLTHAKRHFPVSKLVLIDKVAFLIARNLGSNFRFHQLIVLHRVFVFIGFEYYCRLRFNDRVTL